ncbi:MAG: hypothetical protein ACOCZ5_01525, partial [bacterium]
LIIMLLTIVSVVSAQDYQYGIYEEDTDFDIVENVTDAKVTHLRDDYYGIAYTDNSNNGYLRVVEVNNDSGIVDNNVDEWQFGSSLEDISIVNMDNTTGLSVVAYNLPEADNYLKSFDVYSNGTIRTSDSEQIYQEDFRNIEIIKTSDSTIMSLNKLRNNFGGTTFLYLVGFDISVSGTITKDDDDSRYHNIDTGYITDENLVKNDGICYLYYKLDGKGQYSTTGCNNYQFNGGDDSRSTVSGDLSNTQFEANEIYNLIVDYDEDSGFTYMAYGETLDKYPVLAVYNGTTLKDKERLFDDTTEDNKVFTLSSNYFLGTYTLDDGLYAKSYTVANDGTFTEEYDDSVFINSGFHDLIKLPTTYDSYLLAFETYDDLSLRTLGIGIIPPPDPEDTSLTIKDEKTLGDLDFTDLNLTFYAYCEDNVAYQTDITSTTTSIPVSCEYEGFRIKVNYQNPVNVTESYTRYYLRDLEDTYEQFDLDVYLINPYTTDFVTTQILVDDLRSVYTDAQVFFEKNIDGSATQITAFDLDLEDKIRAVLMTDELYYVYIDSSETTKEFLGKFLSAPAGTYTDYKKFYLYDIQMSPDYSKVSNKINYQIYQEDYQVEYKAVTSEDIQENLINSTFKIFDGNVNDTIIYEETVGSSYDPDNLYTVLSGGPFNYSSYQNDTLTASLNIFFEKDGEIRQIYYVTVLWYGDGKLTLPLAAYVDQDFLDWVLLILISIIALYATIQTANMASLVIIGLAALFVIFGWFSVGIGTLALAAMISLISLLAKKGDAQ